MIILIVIILIMLIIRLCFQHEENLYTVFMVHKIILIMSEKGSCNVCPCTVSTNNTLYTMTCLTEQRSLYVGV